MMAQRDCLRSRPGGVAIVQDPKEAITPDMPANALRMVDVDYCLPLRQIAKCLVKLVEGEATDTTDGPSGGSDRDRIANATGPKDYPSANMSRSPARNAAARFLK